MCCVCSLQSLHMLSAVSLCVLCNLSICYLLFVHYLQSLWELYVSICSLSAVCYWFFRRKVTHRSQDILWSTLLNKDRSAPYMCQLQKTDTPTLADSYLCKLWNRSAVTLPNSHSWLHMNLVTIHLLDQHCSTVILTAVRREMDKTLRKNYSHARTL